MQLFIQTSFPLVFFTPLPCSPLLLCVLAAAEAFPAQFFPACATLYKRRNYQTSSGAAPRECSLRALVRAGSKIFIFILAGSIFFPVKKHLPKGSNRPWKHPELPNFHRHRKKNKGEKGDGAKKTHRETRINKFNQAKGPEEGRGSDLSTQNQDLHPFSQE